MKGNSHKKYLKLKAKYKALKDLYKDSRSDLDDQYEIELKLHDLLLKTKRVFMRNITQVIEDENKDHNERLKIARDEAKILEELEELEDKLYKF